MKIGLEKIKINDFENALKQFNLALSYFPKNLSILTNIALCQWQLKNHDEAIKIFKKVVVQEPNNPDYHAHLGQSLIENNKIEEGITELREALKLQPDFLHMHYFIGDTYLKQSRFDEAIKELNKIIEQPKNENFKLYDLVYHSLAAAYERIGDKNKFIESAREAAKLGNIDAINYFKRENLEI